MTSRSATLWMLFFISNYTFAQISFQNKAADLGINVNCGDSFLGSGISFFDYDNDGLDDITLATAQGDEVRFFKNINGNFVEQFLNIDENNNRSKQINWVDIDNDGDNDLFITSDTSSNKLYENLGNMVMQDITQSSGILTDVLFTYGASWGDYNNDGFLDVFLSIRDTTIPNILYKNNGNNTFTIVNNEAGLLNYGKLSFCSAFFDYNKDGFQDIYVANDKMQFSNILYKNNGDGTFTDVSALSGTDLSIDAMSVTIDDYNNDGWMDIYVTNDVPGNVMLKNNGDGTFSDISISTQTQVNSVCWGAVFLDADNDNDLDLYVSTEHTGSVSEHLSSAFYENLGDDTFNLDNSVVPDDFAKSFSNAIGDINNDGYPEIVVNNINHDNIFVWKNYSAQSNNWLKVKLEGSQSNRNGIGSLIEISINGEKQYRYTLCGEGYLSQNSATEIFGLNERNEVDYVKVKWLSGIEDVIYSVNANQTLNIIEGSTLSVENYLQDSMRIYPNPVINHIELSSNNYITELRISNVLGQEVLFKQPNSLTVNLDLSAFKPGMYLVKTITSMGSRLYKIIKQ